MKLINAYRIMALTKTVALSLLQSTSIRNALRQAQHYGFLTEIKVIELLALFRFLFFALI